jgi:hypothetical protein
MQILVACEQSGLVREAFENKGHEAWSCDLEESEKPGRHVMRDVTPLLMGEWWDLIICFPPCTHLCSSGARWFKEKKASGEQELAIEFFMQCANAKCEKVAIENPIGIMSRLWRKPDQIIQPWQFGHGETKATCLWLRGLEKLKPTKIVEGRENRIWKMPPGQNRGRERSRTYEGIAEAMAEQWGREEKK